MLKTYPLSFGWFVWLHELRMAVLSENSAARNPLQSSTFERLQWWHEGRYLPAPSVTRASSNPSVVG